MRWWWRLNPYASYAAPLNYTGLSNRYAGAALPTAFNYAGLSDRYACTNLSATDVADDSTYVPDAADYHIPDDTGWWRRGRTGGSATRYVHSSELHGVPGLLTSGFVVSLETSCGRLLPTADHLFLRSYTLQ